MSADVRDIQERFRSLDTEALKALWCRDERLPIAEKELRRELVERGISEEEIVHLAGLRQELARQTAERQAADEFGMFGPLLGLGLGAALSAVANALFGWRSAVVVAICAGVIFSFFLLHFVRYRFANSPHGLSWVGFKGVLLLVGIAIGIAYGVYSLFQ